MRVSGHYYPHQLKEIIGTIKPKNFHGAQCISSVRIRGMSEKERHVACIDCKHRTNEWFLVGGNPFVKCKKDKKLHRPEDTCQDGEFRE